MSTESGEPEQLQLYKLNARRTDPYNSDVGRRRVGAPSRRNLELNRLQEFPFQLQVTFASPFVLKVSRLRETLHVYSSARSASETPPLAANVSFSGILRNRRFLHPGLPRVHFGQLLSASPQTACRKLVVGTPSSSQRKGYTDVRRHSRMQA